MQLVKLLTWKPQFGSPNWFFSWACGATALSCAASGALDPPPKNPVIAWPNEDPMATPLQSYDQYLPLRQMYAVGELTLQCWPLVQLYLDQSPGPVEHLLVLDELLEELHQMALVGMRQ